MLWPRKRDSAKLVASATILNPVRSPASTQIGAILPKASLSEVEAEPREDSATRKGARLDLLKFVPFRLNRLALQCIVPGGLLVSASCTSQVSPDMFRNLLAAAAAQAGCRLTLFHEAGQPVDHPVAAHFPEGRYLKFVIGRVTGLP